MTDKHTHNDEPVIVFSPRDFGIVSGDATLADSQVFGGYTNLVSPAVFAADGSGYMIATVDGPATGDLDAVLKRYDPLMKEWSAFRAWSERDDGKHGQCGVGIRGADLVVSRSVRDRDTNQQVVVVEVIPAVVLSWEQLIWNKAVNATLAVLREWRIIPRV